MRVRTLPWPEIASQYASLVKSHGWPIEPMLEMVRFLAGSPYADGLFACTSHDQLRMGRVPDFVVGDNELRIVFNSTTRVFEFAYFQSPSTVSPWIRKCGEVEWKEVLERILQERLGWFSG